MLSKSFRFSQNLVNYNFGVWEKARTSFYNFQYKENLKGEDYNNTHVTPLKSIFEGRVSNYEEKGRQYHATKLDNGITVLTEDTIFPSQVDIGILINIGTRDENAYSSGSLASIKSTMFKSILNSNETTNFGVHQMSGGNFNVSFDQESLYFSASSLQQDTIDVFNVLSDCALEPRSIMASEVGKYNLNRQHKLEDQLNRGHKFSNDVFQTAFGNKSIGMPIDGAKSNVDNLSHFTLQKFQLENICPSKIFISGAGVNNHEEFVNLVNQKLSQVQYNDKAETRPQAEYIGGEVRNNNESDTTNIGFYFKGLPSANLSSLLLKYVLQEQFQTQILDQLPYFDEAEVSDFHFQDTGLFGVRVKGASSNNKDIVSKTCSLLKNIDKYSEQDLKTAKSVIIMEILTALENQENRLEDATKSVIFIQKLCYLGKVKVNDYQSEINKITLNDVKKAAKEILSSKLTFVSEGGNIQIIQSYQEVQAMLK